MKFTTEQLDNGLMVVTDHIPDAKGASVRWGLRSGARQDEFEGAGHYLEHLLASNKEAVDGDELIKRLKKISSDYNLTTGKESINAHADVLPCFVPEIIRAFGDMASRPHWTPHVFQREKNRIGDEFVRQASNSRFMLYLKSCEIAYGDHALSRTILGPLENIQAMTEDHCHSYWDRCFKADRMVLTISGPVPHEDNVRLARESFGSLQSGSSVNEYAPVFSSGHVCTIQQPASMETLWVTFPMPSSLEPRKNAASINMMLLLNRTLADVFEEAGLYESPEPIFGFFTDGAFMGLKHDIEPDRAAFSFELIDKTLRNSAAWLRKEEFHAMQHISQTSSSFSFLLPNLRAESIKSRFTMRGDCVSYEDIMAEDESVRFDEITEAFESFDPDKHNIVGYGPMENLPKLQGPA